MTMLATVLRAAKLTEHVVFIWVLLYACKYMRMKGVRGLFALLLRHVRTAPVVRAAVRKVLDNEVEKSVALLFARKVDVPDIYQMPEKGTDTATLRAWLRTLQAHDADAATGKLFAYAYPTSQEHEETIKEAHNMFMQHNALSPVAFPALRKFEVEVVRMAAAMLNGDANVRGSVTSGGSESLLLAVKTYRDLAHDTRGVTEPEMISCTTAHAVFEKAAQYFGVKSVKVGFKDGTYEMDVEQIRRYINKNTILIIASAPQYPHGVIDPIESIGEIAAAHNIPLHVDACVGGFILPWVKSLGFPVREFDFSIPAVTSISADVHKYGYSIKGASVILYRNENYRKYQFFAYGGWNGGLYISATMQGTRGGGTMAAAWASMMSMGRSGYMKYAREIMETKAYIQYEVENMGPDLNVLGSPAMTIIAIESKTLNIFTIADVMEDQFKWCIERQQNPDSIHMTFNSAHTATREQFITNLKASLQIVKTNPDLESKGTAAMYGMMGKIPDGTVVDDFLVTLMSRIYS